MFGSDISVLSALVYSVLGICIVFLMLIILWGVILLLAAILKRRKTEQTVDFVPELSQSAISSANAMTAPGSAGDVMLWNVDDRDAAMLMAIVADTIGCPLNELRFISIREVSAHEV